MMIYFIGFVMGYGFVDAFRLGRVPIPHEKRRVNVAAVGCLSVLNRGRVIAEKYCHTSA